MSPDQTDEVFGTHRENVSHVIGFLVPLLDPRALSLPVTVGMPLEVMQLMKLYPQPIQQSGVEYLPIDVPRQRRV